MIKNLQQTYQCPPPQGHEVHNSSISNVRGTEQYLDKRQI